MRGVMIIRLYILGLLSLNAVECFDFWNASSTNVALPSRLIIDSEHNVLIVAAKNSICHLSTNLKEQFNVLSAEPNSAGTARCTDELFEPVENCQNYPNVLTLSSGSYNISSRNGTMYPIADTVLFCGSNALSPQCEYRHRQTLEVLSFLSGVGFIPYKYNTGARSMLISSGQLVSATPINSQGDEYKISMSDSPYTGQVAVTTLPSNPNWFYNSPTFVSMHEIGDYIYVFFREEAIEAQEKVVYSRVARVCKNDTGSSELGAIFNLNIFTTFIKARISCTSGTGTSSDIPFHYNEIQDTFFVPSGSSEGVVGSEEQLFAVFNSARNGPIGSAVCVFTFNTQEDNNNIATVYNGDYLKHVSQQWVTESNYQPFTCEPGSRSLEDSRDIQLMKETVTSSNGPRPLLTSEKYLFDKIVVSQVTALDNRTYDIVFVAAHSSDELVVLKASLSQGQEYHVIHSEVLGRPTHISEMQLSEEGHIYLTTNNGVYGLSVANCSAYTDCCSCVAARDPFCAYDTPSDTCVSVFDASMDSIQDVTSGNTTYCPSTCDEVVTTQPSTQMPTTIGCVQSTTTESTSTTSAPTSAPDTPSIGGIETSNSTPLKDHTWTIVGAVVGFVIGVFVGMLVTAFFFRRSNVLRHDRRHRRRRHDLEDHGNERKSFTNRDSRKTSGVSSASIPKPDEYMKNNNVRPNEYTDVHQSKSSSGCDSKFSATYPSIHESSGSHVAGPVPVHVPPPTPPYKKTASTFSFDKSPNDPPRYSSVTPQIRSDPNLKSNLRAEEPINNWQRTAYGPNILARAPSIDASKHSKYSKTTLPVISPTLRFSTQQEFVKVPDAETGCSQC